MQPWLLILADLRSAWYSTLARTRPMCSAEDPSKLLGALSTGARRLVQAGAAHESERWHIREERVLRQARSIHAEPHFVFDMRAALLRRLGDESFPDRESLRAALMEFLRTDLEESLIGPAHSPRLKALFPVLWQARALLKDLVVDDPALPRELHAGGARLVRGLRLRIPADGPPPQRYAELIALADAGLVDFAGRTGPRHDVWRRGARDIHRDEPRCAGLAPRTRTHRRESLAREPRPAGRRLADRSMLDRGQLCAATHDLDDGTRVPSSGLAVTGTRTHCRCPVAPGTPIATASRSSCSSVQLGLAIAANPRTDAQTLRDADAVARAVLGLG